MIIDTERLQYEIFRNKITQRDLARMAGITETSISRYISGARTPRPAVLAEIAKVLNTTPEYLTNTERFIHPDNAFSKTKVMIESFAKNWTPEQRKSLVIRLMNASMN